MRRSCPVCTVSFEANDVGRPRRWCSPRCRQRAHVARKTGTPPGGRATFVTSREDQAAGRPRDVALPRVFGEPARRLVPGTPEYAEAWRLHPDRIAAQLTPEERLDPEKNPYHLLADSWPPGHAAAWAKGLI